MERPRREPTSEIVRAVERGHRRKASRLLREVGHELTPEELNDVLWQSAISGFAEGVGATLNLGARVDVRDIEGGTPLMVAALLGRTECVRVLLAAGADPNHVRLDGRTALMQAARAGDVGSIELLVEAGVDLDVRTPEGECALTAATSNGKSEAAARLLDAGAHADVRANDGRPFLSSLARGARELVDRALGRGADVHAASDYGARTALHEHAGVGDAEAVRTILAAGADVDVRDADGRTPLLSAAGCEFPVGDPVETVEALIHAGADVHATGYDGRGALALAAGHLPAAAAERVVVRLLEEGTSVDPPEAGAESALHAAASHGRVGVLDLLLGHGADPEFRGPKGFTALLYAARAGDRALGTAALLLERGADVDARAEDGHTAITLAAGRGSLSMVRLLVTREARVTPDRADGPTALGRAAAEGRTEVVRELLGLGVDPNLPERGAPVLFPPCARAHLEVVRALLDAGADPNAGPPVPLIGALAFGTEPIADGRPWHRPRSRRDDPAAEVIELLLAAGADPDVATTGSTALELAEQYRCRDVVRMLRRASAEGSPAEGPEEPPSA